MMLDTGFLERIAPYIEPLTDEGRAEYIAEGEESIKIREKEGLSPRDYLQLVENIGLYLGKTTGAGFDSHYQKIPLTKDKTLLVIQLPGGGNLNVFLTPEGKMILDTGYGCYYKDCERMLNAVGAGDFSDVKFVVCTHGDADHCGASGYFPVTPVMHPVTKELLESGTRGYASPNGREILEKFYTTTINTYSRMNIPETVRYCKTEPVRKHGLFPVIDEFEFAGMRFEVWASLGGHIAGQIFLYEPDEGLLFTSDALLNFATLTKARADYSSIADSMIGSVNVNSDIARTERRELMRITKELDDELKKSGRRLLICCGHGAVSILDEKGMLSPYSEPLYYSAGSC
ncbi:MAG: MBL fold metallo-hydrolase [Methanocorpusculum sp.]|uniref:MBL fold metallo-hydrolase n=1 Tax=Methanocorpusculum sp. TaxID=2058474 RepID=UPI0027292C15|nr:MBL fold metallo-hydrolase [Methanocorpusculum sp.]MDO9522320.1 MBL fold metallo-hydrolase [Methanocorpusculum sp.]